MLKQLLCIAIVLSAVGCGPVVPNEAEGIFDGGQEELKISASESNPVYNRLSYSEREEPHAVIEKTFVLRSGERERYSLFGYFFESSQCLEDKGRADYGLFLISGSRVVKLEKIQEFTLGANDLIKVSVDNTAGCKTINLSFAAVKE